MIGAPREPASPRSLGEVGKPNGTARAGRAAAPRDEATWDEAVRRAAVKPAGAAARKHHEPAAPPTVGHPLLAFLSSAEVSPPPVSDRVPASSSSWTAKPVEAAAAAAPKVDDHPASDANAAANPVEAVAADPKVEDKTGPYANAAANPAARPPHASVPEFAGALAADVTVAGRPPSVQTSQISPVEPPPPPPGPVAASAAVGHVDKSTPQRTVAPVRAATLKTAAKIAEPAAAVPISRTKSDAVIKPADRAAIPTTLEAAAPLEPGSIKPAPAAIPSPAVDQPAVAATPAGLAAAITAMHRSGQANLVLRLDPPHLGTLAVHVAAGEGAKINLVFVPALPQTGHLLMTGLDSLRHSLSEAGLAIGQAQVGDGGQNGGAAADGGGSAPPFPRDGARSEPAAAPAPAGIRAYA